MRLSILQLNIYAGTYWNEVIKYLSHNMFDVLQLQEIVGAGTRVTNIDAKENTYEKLAAFLGDSYNGRLYKTETFETSPTAFDGIATFMKKDFTIIEEQNIIQREAAFPFTKNRRDFEHIGRGALALKVKKEGKIFWLLNTHLAWSPTPQDSEEKITQATILYNFLQARKEPFIFTGDMNAEPNTKTIKQFNTISQNLTAKYQVTNTLNPHRHTASHLFPPGIAVDYIFVSQDIEVVDFAVVMQSTSDHLGLTAVVSI